MKNIFRTINTRLATLFVILILVLLLVLAPWMLGSLMSVFATLDQHTLFNKFLLVGVLGLIFYVCVEVKNNLHVPYAVSALIFGISGYGLWNMLFAINSNVYLILGTAAVAFAVFRRGLSVNIHISRKVFWQQIFVGVITSLVLFILSNLLLGMVFPELSEALRYSIAGVLLILGAHLKEGPISSVGTARFAYDMTILVVLYNFLLFSSRIAPDSLLSISGLMSVYSTSLTSTIYGIIIGLIGAYLLHRHHSIWIITQNENRENVYTITLLCGLLALSFLVGANPFIAAGIMGLLVTIRDVQNNPEEHVLVKIESGITIVVFMIIGASIPLGAVLVLVTFGSIVTIFMSIIVMLFLGLVFFFFSKIGMLPNASMKSYMIETYSRHDATIITGALTLFSIAYLRTEYMLLVISAIMFVIAVEYLYPWILHLVISKT